MKWFTVPYHQKNVTKCVPRVVAATLRERRTARYMKTIRLIKLRHDLFGYLVEWTDGVEHWHSNAELRSGLSTDETKNLSEWLSMVDRFMASENDNLTDFMRTDNFGRSYRANTAGADMDGLCGFRAVQMALTWCNVGQIWDDALIDQYCQCVLANSNIDLKTTGTTYSQLRGFIRGLPQDLGSVDINTLNINLFQGRGRGHQGVADVLTEDGVYLVCGTTEFDRIGHVMTVYKKQNILIACDGLGEKPLSSQSWLGPICFVRRFLWEDSTTSAATRPSYISSRL